MNAQASTAKTVKKLASKGLFWVVMLIALAGFVTSIVFYASAAPVERGRLASSFLFLSILGLSGLIALYSLIRSIGYGMIERLSALCVLLFGVAWYLYATRG